MSDIEGIYDWIAESGSANKIAEERGIAAKLVQIARACYNFRVSARVTAVI